MNKLPTRKEIEKASRIQLAFELLAAGVSAISVAIIMDHKDASSV